MVTSALTHRQQAELDWWRGYLDHPTAKQRMWALYGARYYPFFWQEMDDAGSTVELGSGPLPVMEIMNCRNMLAVDPLADEYKKLTGWPVAADIDAIDVRGRWDTVLLLNVLDHADDPESLVRGAYRLLRAGKRALVYVQLHDGDERHSALTELDVIGWLKAAGFDIAREAVIARQFDPLAYCAVATKPALTDEQAMGVIAGAFDSTGADWWLTCGGALGYHRDGSLIPWDHDIDIAVRAGTVQPAAVRDAVEAAGFRLWRRIGTPGDGYVMQFEHELIPRTLDVYFMYARGEEIWMAVYPVKGRRRYIYPKGVFDSIERRDFLGQRIPIPPLEYVELQYGYDWREPDPSWDWAEDPPCIR